MKSKINRLSIEKDCLKEQLLPLLRGKVFHFTTHGNFKKIAKTGSIKNNKNNDFPIVSSSNDYYGKKRGYVCLIDLRNQTDEVINDALLKYRPLLYPSRELGNRFVYLILGESTYPNIIENKVAINEVGYGEQFVPHVECWYPDDIGLGLISEILDVTIIRKPMSELERAIWEVDREANVRAGSNFHDG